MQDVIIRRIKWVRNHDCVVKRVATGSEVWTPLITETGIDRNAEKRRELQRVGKKDKQKHIFLLTAALSALSPQKVTKTCS